METLAAPGAGRLARLRRLLLPRSLGRQFALVVAGLALLILAGGATAIYALRVGTAATRVLAEERLVRMQQAQDLVQRTMFIERNSYQLSEAVSAAAMRARYTDIVEQLEVFDRLADQLAAGGDELAILELHQSGQLFRNTANIVAQLRESELEAAGAVQPGAKSRQFLDELRQQASALVAAARLQSDRFSLDFRAAVQELAHTSTRNQRWVSALLAASLVLAGLAAYSFLGKHVLARLQLVSQSLRRRDTEAAPLTVTGDDEIGEMARAVEQFQQDRRQLAVANAALEVEKARQEELIRKLAEAHSQLLQSEKMASIGQLAAGVAHEINNPVAFVNSNLGSLQQYVADLFKALAAYEAAEAELTPATRAAVTALKRQIDLVFLREDVASLLSESVDGLQRVKRIVQDLKDFSHVDQTELQPANLEKGLDSTVNVAWSELKHKVELVKEYGAISEIECMPSHLNQVFLNLLINAAHAIEGQGRITLRTGQDDDNVWVEVEDNGKGISAEHLDRIFDPFFTTKPVGVGTGLGLSLSYGIVKQHGGRIDVRSAPGKGSVFRVVLPRHAALATL
ncbi:MAG: ATP-binding protein [Pseudomonadota bacterium]